MKINNLTRINKEIFDRSTEKSPSERNHKQVLSRQSICADLFDWEKIKSFLELGGSSSNFVEHIQLDPEIYLVDIVPPKYDYKNLSYINCDLNDGLPFQSEIFDAVYAGEIIEHILDTDRFLKDIHRVLKPKGTLVITTPNASAFINLYKWLKKDQFVHNDYKVGQNGHVRYYSPKALVEQIKFHGFKVKKILDTPIKANLIKNQFMRKHIYHIRRSLFPLRGKNILVKCVK